MHTKRLSLVRQRGILGRYKRLRQAEALAAAQRESTNAQRVQATGSSPRIGGLTLHYKRNTLRPGASWWGFEKNPVVKTITTPSPPPLSPPALKGNGAVSKAFQAACRFPSLEDYAPPPRATLAQTLVTNERYWRTLDV